MKMFNKGQQNCNTFPLLASMKGYIFVKNELHPVSKKKKKKPHKTSSKRVAETSVSLPLFSSILLQSQEFFNYM